MEHERAPFYCIEINLRVSTQLQKKLKAIIPEEKKIFYNDFATFKKKTRFTKITPGLNDNNILLDKSINLDFIEKNIKFNNILKSFFGGDYTIDSKWLIKVLPRKLMPKWVSEEVKDIGITEAEKISIKVFHLQQD